MPLPFKWRDSLAGPVAGGIVGVVDDIAVTVIAFNQTDDQAAEQLQKERSKLFKTINERDLKSG